MHACKFLSIHLLQKGHSTRELGEALAISHSKDHVLVFWMIRRDLQSYVSSK